MIRIIYLLFLLTLTNCRYFNVSPVNGITTKNLTEKPTQSEMTGIWEVDNFSYELIQERGYETKIIELSLKQDHTFKITNLPNFINVFEKTTEKNVDTNGTWKIGKDFKDERWVLNMNFVNSSLYESGMLISYDLYIQDGKIIIWNFIGDPDSGERFLYTKK